jgi:hypothetical protein
MPLQAFRVHTGKCEKGYKRADREHQDCRCKISVEGKLGNRLIRSSTGTRSLRLALALIENAEKTGNWKTAQDIHDTPSAKGTVPIQTAIRVFLDHCASKSGKDLPRATVSEFRTALERLEEFCDDSGCPRMSEIDESVLIAFQDSWSEWPISSRPSARYISLLKAFGDFCLERDWWFWNHANGLKKPTNYKHPIHGYRGDTSRRDSFDNAS